MEFQTLEEMWFLELILIFKKINFLKKLANVKFASFFYLALFMFQFFNSSSKSLSFVLELFISL